jgi:response regulator RpfG family c-di-GMP phosphodiesterase
VSATRFHASESQRFPTPRARRTYQGAPSRGNPDWSPEQATPGIEIADHHPGHVLGEYVATLALAQDNAFGQPLESQLRSCLLATWMCEAAGFDRPVRETVYWVALLRYIGCTGHAHEVATLFGDEIAIRAQTLVHDAGNPAEVMRDVVAYATAGRSTEEQEEIIRLIQQTAREWAVYNFSSGCEVADMLVQRLDFSPAVREALRFTFERWNGAGYPAHAKGETIPLAMRVVHVSHDMEAIGRLFSRDRALDAVRDRRDRTYDPALADLFVTHGGGWFDRLETIEPWDSVLELEPRPRRMLDGDELDNALAVAADFIDLKSPYMGGHSRRCAELAADAARVLGFTEESITRLRRAAMVHDFGITAVPNSIWDKPGSLTRTEFDRVELHPLLTEQMLRPGGLTRREVEVLRLAARGFTTSQIADRLFISPKTADHHIQHIYGKIAVSTRAAAALWAMEHGVVSTM